MVVRSPDVCCVIILTSHSTCLECRPDVRLRAVGLRRSRSVCGRARTRAYLTSVRLVRTYEWSSGVCRVNSYHTACLECPAACSGLHSSLRGWAGGGPCDHSVLTTFVGRRGRGPLRNGGPVRGGSSAPPAAASVVEVAVPVRGGTFGGLMRCTARSNSVSTPSRCGLAAVAGGCADFACLRFHDVQLSMSSSSWVTSSTQVRLAHTTHPPALGATLMTHSAPPILPSSANLPPFGPLCSQDQERFLNAEELRSTKDTYECAAVRTRAPMKRRVAGRRAGRRDFPKALQSAFKRPAHRRGCRQGRPCVVTCA